MPSDFGPWSSVYTRWSRWCETGLWAAVLDALAPGQMADVQAAQEIVIPSASLRVCDKGYDSDEFCREIQARGSKPCVPPRKGRKAPRTYHRGYYKKRHRVENFFQRVKRFRRVGTRYEKLALNFLVFVVFAAVMDWLKT